MKRSPIKRRNLKRAAREFARAYHSDARVKWVNSLPCHVCGVIEGGEWKVVNAHTETGGAARKADYTTIIPLCTNLHQTGCHDWQHRYGWSTLQLQDPDTRKAAAAEIERAWLATQHREDA